MGSGSDVLDGAGVTCMGHPTSLYPSLDNGPNCPTDLGDLLASPRWRLCGSLRILPGKAEAKVQGVGTKTLITLVSKNAKVVGA